VLAIGTLVDIARGWAFPPQIRGTVPLQ